MDGNADNTNAIGVYVFVFVCGRKAGSRKVITEGLEMMLDDGENWRGPRLQYIRRLFNLLVPIHSHQASDYSRFAFQYILTTLLFHQSL